MNEQILEYIKQEQLYYLSKNDLVKLLSAQYRDYAVKNIIGDMIDDGTLVVDERGKVATAEFKGYQRAKVIGNAKGYAFCVLESGGDDVFVPNNAINTATDGDTVLVKIVGRQAGYNPEGVIMKVIARSSTTIVGVIKRKNNTATVKADDNNFFQTIYVTKNNVGTASDGDKVVVEILDFGGNGKKITGKVTEVLGKSADKKTEQLSIIKKHKLKMDFDTDTLNEARQIRSVVLEKDWAGRKDFRKDRIVTIDGSDTRDVDDAISISPLKDGLYRLGIHIADVSHYVTAGSALDEEAFLRGTSVYFPDSVLPMLPKELSNGICSLNEGVDRLALSVLIDIDLDGNITRSSICESVINVKAHLVYRDVTAALEGDAVQCAKLKPYLEDFELYKQLTLSLEKKRKDRGAINMEMPEAYIEVDENGDITNIRKRERTISHRMIESMMILANEQVAEKYFVKKAPFVYRIHDKPDTTRLANFIKFAESQGITKIIDPEDCSPILLQNMLDSIDDDNKRDLIARAMLRSMAKAKYDPACIGHFGLASTFYCHFTSPIRRYPDLAIHRIIKRDINQGISSESKIYFEDFVQRASTQSSAMEKQADECEREVSEYKKCIYMKNFIGQTYDAMISTVTNFGIFVELDNTVDGLVHMTNLPKDKYTFDDERKVLVGGMRRYAMGDRIRVTLDSVDELSKKIDFVIEGVPKGENKAVESKKHIVKKEKVQYKNKKSKKR